MVTEFSLIIPARDEDENLEPLMAEVHSMLEAHHLECEILMVNDGSRDRTLQVMQSLREKYPQHQIRVLSLDRNHGLSAAMAAGFQSSSRDVVVTIDADLQNDPADIPRLLEKIPEYDVVIGVRRKRRDSVIKKWSSRIANSLRDSLLKEHWQDTGCSLKAFRKEYLRRIKMFTGMHRFLPTLLKMEGARILEMEVNHRPRIHGRSKYYLWNRLTGPFMDLLAVRWMKKRHAAYRIEEEKVPDKTRPGL